MAAIAFAAVFAIFFVWNLLREFHAQPVVDILEQETPEADLLKGPLTGFVAMEYYWLILNRTFLIFVAPQGLYGWRANGPVDGRVADYFKPYLEMLRDKEFMRDFPSIERLSQLRGGFFFAKSTISSVASDYRQKWGLWMIEHSGRVHVRLTSGKSREFIVLGDADPDTLRDRIVSTLGVGVTSVV